VRGLFQDKYRIASARLQNWDYAKEAMYFVTICSKNRENYFGEIINGQIHFSKIGEIAQSEWFKTIEMRQDMNLYLGEFVVMPNHVHGIIHIGNNEFNAPTGNICRDAMHCVSTNIPGPNPEHLIHEYKNQFAPQSKNLASIIRGYKSAVTTYARKNNLEFNWQARFHDHIIRSTGAYHRISDYIKQNPANWLKDKFHHERK
jgi:putative transposase